MTTTEMQSDFSVFVLCYNHERFIKECLESILNQDTDEPFDIVIADDASKDDSVKVIEALINGHPLESRITFIKNEKNLGLSRNCWNAIQQCKGKYLIACGGDDVSRADRVRELIALQKKYPDAKAFSSLYDVMDEYGKRDNLPDKEGDRYCVRYPKMRFSSIPMLMGCAAMWDKDCISKLDGSPFLGAEDTVFSYRTYLQRGSVAISNKRLVYYRRHTANLCNSYGKSLKEKLLNYSYFEMNSLAQLERDLISTYAGRGSDYTPEEFEHDFRQLFHHCRHIALFPHAQYGGNFVTKWRWFTSACQTTPKNTFKYAVRLLPRFAVNLYLKYVKR